MTSFWRRLFGRQDEPSPERTRTGRGPRTDASAEIRASQEQRIRELEHQVDAKKEIAEDLREVRHIVEAPGIERQLSTIQEQIYLLTEEARETRQRMEARAAADAKLEEEKVNILRGDH